MNSRARPILAWVLPVAVAGLLLSGCTKKHPGVVATTPPTTQPPPTTPPPTGKARVVGDVTANAAHPATSLTIQDPPNAAGKLMVARIVAVGSHPGRPATAPSGWNPVIYNLHSGIWYRIGSASDPANWTWHAQAKHGGTDLWFGEIVVIAGATTVDASSGQPLCSSAGDFVCNQYAGDVKSTCLSNGCAVQMPAPSVTLPSRGLVLGFWGGHRGAAPIALPSGFNQIAMDDKGVSVASGWEDFGPGPTGVQTATANRPYTHGIAQLVAVR